MKTGSTRGMCRTLESAIRPSPSAAKKYKGSWRSCPPSPESVRRAPPSPKLETGFDPANRSGLRNNKEFGWFQLPCLKQTRLTSAGTAKFCLILIHGRARRLLRQLLDLIQNTEMNPVCHPIAPEPPVRSRPQPALIPARAFQTSAAVRQARERELSLATL